MALFIPHLVLEWSLSILATLPQFDSAFVNWSQTNSNFWCVLFGQNPELVHLRRGVNDVVWTKLGVGDL